MSDTQHIFDRLQKVINIEGGDEFMHCIFKISDTDKTYKLLSDFLYKITKEIDALSFILQNNDKVLISVKHQKLLRTSFHLVMSFGISSCLLPGIGVSLSKRCVSAQSLPNIILTDEQKYDLLTTSTNFLHRSYCIPVLKNIIITFHLSDYLAALIQLAFAPLKKPGIYTNFTMTEQMYKNLNIERCKFSQMYEYIVKNCFQPMLMKELLVLQNITDKTPPVFVKRVIAKEMSQQLIAPGGLLSLIRCFIDSHTVDTGIDWKKIDMICKIVVKKHGNLNENEYLTNICAQLKQILSLNNPQYLVMATSCLISLYEKCNQNDSVQTLVLEMLEPFNYISLVNKFNLPGTIILTAQDVDHNLLLLHSCINIPKFTSISLLMSNNIPVLFLLSIKCSKGDTKNNVIDIILKGLDCLGKDELLLLVGKLLFGHEKTSSTDILVEEYDAGLTIKSTSCNIDYPMDDAVIIFTELFNRADNSDLIGRLFESCLQIFIALNSKRNMQTCNESIHNDKEPELFNKADKKYINILNLLSEISSSEKVVGALTARPLIVIDFVDKLFLNNFSETNNECTTIALVLLNTVLANINKSEGVENRLHNLLPILTKLRSDETNLLSILCKETISLIISDYPQQNVTLYEKAISNIYDKLLPVQAHGIMELTKLIDLADPETISKRHFVFCLLQEQLKNADSYVYLAAINGIAALAIHCTSDVLTALCAEFLNIDKLDVLETLESQKRNAEFRMKIGDIIVKVTRKLGEMAVSHKSTLLNTILCGCRDEDPLLRASALSNLAEIALVLHYRIGSIIYEVLLCIESIIETDKAIECRRAAVMVISSMLKGLGKNTLLELKDSLLPIYRTLNTLYKDHNEDEIVRLHAQIALEELNDLVRQFLYHELPLEKQFSLLNQDDIKYK